MWTPFERFILAQPVPSLNLPAFNGWTASEWALCDRAEQLFYFEHDEERLRWIAMVAGIIPASRAEIDAEEGALP